MIAKLTPKKSPLHKGSSPGGGLAVFMKLLSIALDSQRAAGVVSSAFETQKMGRPHDNRWIVWFTRILGERRRAPAAYFGEPPLIYQGYLLVEGSR